MSKKQERVRKRNGQWSVPNGTAVPGQLLIDNENGFILLEIYATVDIEGKNADIFFNAITGNSNYFTNFIWGFGGDMGDVTLFQCTWDSSEGLSSGLFINRYRVEFVIIGIHLDKGFKIKSAKLCYPFLGGFFWGHDRLYLPVDKLKFEIPEDYHDKRMPITQNLTFNYKSIIAERLEEPFNKKRIEVEDYVIFQYKEDVTFPELMLDAFTFKRLLEFSYGQSLPFQLELIFPDTVSIDAKHSPKMRYFEFKKNGFPIINFSLSSAKEIEMGTLNQNAMLLSKWTISLNDLEKVIQHWFKQSRMNNIVEYYLETVKDYDGESPKLTNVMINNRFLNLIQGLEDYYREVLELESKIKEREIFENKKRAILSDIDDPSLKKWLNNTFKFTRYTSLEDKLQIIVDSCRPILEKIFRPLDWSRFPSMSKDLRHTLSHGMNKNSSLGNELYLNYYMAKLLLMVCLLQSLEINPMYYKSVLETNYLIDELFGQIVTRQKALLVGRDLQSPT